MPEKVTFKIDGLKIDVAEATFSVDAQKTDLGLPKMDLPIVTAHVRINLNDAKNIKREDIQKLFDLSIALDSPDRIKPIVLEFWTDLAQKNPTACYQFNGWISSMRTSNAASVLDKNGRGSSQYNHVVDLTLTPDYTSNNFKSVKFGN